MYKFLIEKFMYKFLIEKFMYKFLIEKFMYHFFIEKLMYQFNLSSLNINNCSFNILIFSLKYSLICNLLLLLFI